jgi:hypothetical protein
VWIFLHSLSSQVQEISSPELEKRGNTNITIIIRANLISSMQSINMNRVLHATIVVTDDWEDFANVLLAPTSPVHKEQQQKKKTEKKRLLSTKLCQPEPKITAPPAPPKIIFSKEAILSLFSRKLVATCPVIVRRQYPISSLRARQPEALRHRATPKSSSWTERGTQKRELAVASWRSSATSTATATATSIATATATSITTATATSIATATSTAIAITAVAVTVHAREEAQTGTAIATIAASAMVPATNRGYGRAVSAVMAAPTIAQEMRWSKRKEMRR